MKKMLLAAAMLTAVAVPALAQPGRPYGPPPPLSVYGPPPPPGSIWDGAPARLHDRVAFLDARLQRLRQAGRLSPGPYYNFHRDLMNIGRSEQEMRYRDGGELSPQDRQVLWQRLQLISSKVNWDSHLAY